MCDARHYCLLFANYTNPVVQQRYHDDNASRGSTIQICAVAYCNYTESRVAVQTTQKPLNARSIFPIELFTRLVVSGSKSDSGREIIKMVSSSLH